MFGLLKNKNPYEQDARAVYERLMAASRKPVLYTDMGVPDTFDGRFDCLIAHTFMVVEVLNEKDLGRADVFNQALFDRIFVQMHVTLREIGVGDVGIPKHQQKMMKAFNGRVHAYSEALTTGALKESLVRNLYGTVDSPSDDDVQAFARYMMNNIERLRALDFDEIVNKENLFEI